jgi:hypothetical protein
MKRHPLSAPRVLRDGAAHSWLSEAGQNDSQALLGVLHDLRAMLRAENEALKWGLPASIVEDTDRKERLTQAFGVLMRRVTAHGPKPLEQIEARRLYALGTEVRTLSRENAHRLHAALTASERRVETIVGALRQRTQGDTISYGDGTGTARQLRARFVDPGSTLRA